MQAVGRVWLDSSSLTRYEFVIMARVCLDLRKIADALIEYENHW
jgi:hypothetical protein